MTEKGRKGMREGKRQREKGGREEHVKCPLCQASLPQLSVEDIIRYVLRPTEL